MVTEVFDAVGVPHESTRCALQDATRSVQKPPAPRFPSTRQVCLGLRDIQF